MDTVRNTFTEPLRAMVRPVEPPAHPTPWSYSTDGDGYQIHDANLCQVGHASTDDLAEIICIAVNEWAKQ